MVEDKDSNHNNIEEVRKLSPEKRIEKLKELEERIRKQMDSLNELNKQTKQEIKENKEKKFLEIAPEQEEVRIDDLFKEEENLENQVSKENNNRQLKENQQTYLIQKLDENRHAVGNLLNETYTIRTFVNETVSKYNPNLGDRLNKQLFALANELKSLYEHKINK